MAQVLKNNLGYQNPWLTRSRRKAIGFYTFIAPWLIGFVLLGIIPLVLGFIASMTNYDGLNLSSIKFTGISNYARAVADPEARYSMSRTLIWTVLNTPLWIVASFILALFLNQKLVGRGFFRTLFYLPTIMPLVAVVWIWKIFLDKNYGLLNSLISIFVPGTALPWLNTYAMFGLTMVGIWSGLGWGMIIFLAALQDVPDELVEAARIDGASNIQVFMHVTIPMVTPVILFVVINGLISAFQQMALPMLLTQSGPAHDAGVAIPRSVYLFMINVYRQMFNFQRFGYSLALLWIMIVLIVVLTLLLIRTSRSWVFYESDIEGETGT